MHIHCTHACIYACIRCMHTMTAWMHTMQGLRHDVMSNTGFEQGSTVEEFVQRSYNLQGYWVCEQTMSASVCNEIGDALRNKPHLCWQALFAGKDSEATREAHLPQGLLEKDIQQWILRNQDDEAIVFDPRRAMCSSSFVTDTLAKYCPRWEFLVNEQLQMVTEHRCFSRRKGSVIALRNFPDGFKHNPNYSADKYATRDMVAQGWHRDHTTERLQEWHRLGQTAPCFVILAIDPGNTSIDLVAGSHRCGQAYTIDNKYCTMQVAQGGLIIVDGGLVHRGSATSTAKIKIHACAGLAHNKFEHGITSLDIDTLVYEEETRSWAQCDICDKWRILPPGQRAPANWQDWSCEHNLDLSFNSCSIPEQSTHEWEDTVLARVQANPEPDIPVHTTANIVANMAANMDTEDSAEDTTCAEDTEDISLESAFRWPDTPHCQWPDSEDNAIESEVVIDIAADIAAQQASQQTTLQTSQRTTHRSATDPIVDVVVANNAIPGSALADNATDYATHSEAIAFQWPDFGTQSARRVPYYQGPRLPGNRAPSMQTAPHRDMFYEYVHKHFKDSSSRIHYTCAVAYNCHWENDDLLASGRPKTSSELYQVQDWCSHFWSSRRTMFEETAKRRKQNDRQPRMT